MAATPPGRMPWIDHTRTLVILLVVSMHACVTYSGVGSWYVKSGLPVTLGQKLTFILWQADLQAFFMGLLFFVSGYFVWGSLTRRTPGAFARERLFRLGLPALLFMLVIQPLMVAGIYRGDAEFPPFSTYYVHYLARGRFLSGTGPLWFVVALLAFSLLYAGFRAVAGTPRPSEPGGPPSPVRIAAFAVILGLVTFAVRLVQPLGTDVFNMQIGYFAQYVAAFAVGLDAGRRGWLVSLASSRFAARAGVAAAFLGPVALVLLFVAAKGRGDDAYAGGWHGPAFALAVWEQVTGVGLSLGVLALMKAAFDHDGPILRWMSDRSFGVYALHAPLLVALFFAFRALPPHPLGLAALMTVCGLVLAYLAASISRLIPGLRSIL